MMPGSVVPCTVLPLVLFLLLDHDEIFLYFAFEVACDVAFIFIFGKTGILFEKNRGYVVLPLFVGTKLLFLELR